VPDTSFRTMALLPGDVVVCEHGVQPRQGDVVAVLMDGASVLRVWTLQGGRPVLRCSDGQEPPASAEELVIQGVAVQVVRERTR
jgi:SOS-response transcriptional repressor LexA